MSFKGTPHFLRKTAPVSRFIISSCFCNLSASEASSSASTAGASPAAGASEVLILPLKNQAFPSFLILFLLRFRILKNNGLIFQSQVSYLIPIFGTILGYIFLKELITIKVLISLIAVCIGIYFVKKADNKKII